MLHGAGLARAIDDAAGPKLVAECSRVIAQIGYLRSGKAVLTGAHNLASIGVPATIHVAAPVFEAARGSAVAAEATALLKASVAQALQLTVDSGYGGIAICGLGCGIFGWPIRQATSAIVAAVREWEARRAAGSLRLRVVLYDWGQEVVDGFLAAVRAPASALSSSPGDAGLLPRASTHNVRWRWGGGVVDV